MAFSDLFDVPGAASSRAPSAAELAEIPRYVAPRTVAGSSMPGYAPAVALDAKAYASAQAKILAALPYKKGAELTPEETRALIVGRSALMTQIRHGGAVPFVPDNGAIVREARRVGGPHAVPDASGGAVVLDPFGFQPAGLSATASKILAGSRQTIRDLLSAPTVSRTVVGDVLGKQGLSLTDRFVTADDPSYRAALAGELQRAAPALAGAAVATFIWPTVVVCLGAYAIYKLGAVGERYIDAAGLREQYAADAALKAHAARLAAGADPNAASPLEQGAADKLRGEGWTKWIGPALALGLAGAGTVAAVKYGPELRKLAGKVRSR